MEAQGCQNGERTKDGIVNRPIKRILDMPGKRILNIEVAE
jgi:hypothetical protein